MNREKTNDALSANESRLTLTALELANLLQVSQRHVWTMLNNGRLGPQPIRLGKLVRWNRAEIEEWFSAGAPTKQEWRAAKRTGTQPTNGHLAQEK